MSSSDAPSAAVRTMTPPSFTLEPLEDVLQPVALVVVEPARDAEALSLRDEDDEAAGQRDLRRQPRALRLHRILDGLDEDRLAALRSGPGSCARGRSRAPGRRSRRRRGSRSSRGRSRRTPPPSRAGRCRRGRGRCCRRSSGAPAARGRPRRPGRPRARRRAARRRRRRRSARASRRAAARGAAARGGGACDWSRRRSCRCESSRRSAAASRARPSARPSSSARGVAPRRRWSRASCARARHGCRGGASAWSDRSVRRRPRRRPGRSAGADRLGLRPRARVRQDVGRRKTLLPETEPGQAKTPSWSARAAIPRMGCARARCQ